MQTHALPLAPSARGPAAARQAERALIALAAAVLAGRMSGHGPAAAASPPVTGPPAPPRPAAPPVLPGPSGPPGAGPIRAGRIGAGQVRAGLSPAAARRARQAALAVGAFLVPWSVMLSVTLPSAAVAYHWSMAWTGLDAAEALAALATAVMLARGDARASLTVMAGGTLLLTDAWFDVCTSAPGAGHALSVAEAACVELPLAAAAFWMAARLLRGADTRIPAALEAQDS
jgi:hypothetical protein